MQYEGLNLLRGIAAFCIVAVHLNMAPMTDWAWRIHDICDMNVGMFAAISGFLMYESVQKGTFLSYLKKRCHRLLPVYFVWTLIFIIFGFIFDVFVRHGLNEKWLNWFFYPKVIFGGQASAHLWFLICLLYIQIGVMGVKRWLDRLSWTVVLALGFSIVAISSARMDVWLFGYPGRMLGFVLSGYALRMRKERFPLSSSDNKHTFLYMMICLIIVTAHLAMGRLPYVAFIKDWFVVVAVLLAFLSVRITTKMLKGVSRLLGETSMGVYLVHPILTAGIGLAIKRYFSPPFGLGVMIADWVICYAIALILSIIMIRIPTLNRIVR